MEIKRNPSKLKQNKTRKFKNKKAVPFLFKLLICLSILITFCNIIKAQPSDFLIGRAFELKNQPDSAVRYFSRAIISKPTDAKLFIFRGNILLSQKKIELAYADFISANKIYPEIANLEIAKYYALKFDTLNTIKYIKKSFFWNFPEIVYIIYFN